jgi:hypothetical protein
MEVGRLKAKTRQLDVDLGDLETERRLTLAREDLATVRVGDNSSTLRMSAAELRQRKEALLDRLAERQGHRNKIGALIGSFVWVFAGVYASVWLSNIRYPEWAFATRLLIVAVLGFVAFLAVSMFLIAH